MFKIISGDFEKGAIYVGDKLIESNLSTYLYNAKRVEVLDDDSIKELLYNEEYSSYAKDLEKTLKETKIVCFEYIYTNGKSFKAIADLNTFHKIQKSGKNVVSEEELSKEDKGGPSCLAGCLSAIVTIVFAGLLIDSCTTSDSSSSSSSMLTQHRIYCADKVKANLNFPTTYKENTLASLSETETINDTDKVTIYFEAKNAFGVTQSYKARCIFDNTKNELTYFNVAEY